MEEMQNRNQHLVESNHFFDFADKFDKTLTLEESSSSSTVQRAENGEVNLTIHQTDNEEEEDEDEDENEEFEFSFFGGETIKSPVSAEEVFEDGQIRIIAPFSGEAEAAEESTTSYRPPVKNYFVVSNTPENDDVAEQGAYCVWKSPTPEMSKKSNSTGFSKFRKMRDLLARSNSDGKDAFVFLNGKNDETTSSSSSSSLMKMMKKKEKVKLEKVDVGKKKEKKEEGETTAFRGERKEKVKEKKKKSAYEVLYGGEKKKGGGKSYLPYRQDLVGFFTNGSGMSRNVHPY